MGHRRPVLRSRYIGPGRARTQVPFIHSRSGTLVLRENQFVRIEDESDIQITGAQNISLISRAEWVRLGWNIKIQFFSKKKERCK
jgi:hypothetical protein